jgi:hypothetical protein
VETGFICQQDIGPILLLNLKGSLILHHVSLAAQCLDSNIEWIAERRGLM